MRRTAPVLALFFLAPLVAEFFLGDFPITMLPLILVLAPMYGGGALLIREVVRRTGRGWPTIALLALAFGVFEEGVLTQSLFNPDYLDAHLLDQGYVPALGTAVPWLVFVLTLHTGWSISTPIAIVEESTRARRTTPWLGRVGLFITAALFVLGSVVTFFISYGMSKHFLASPAQLGTSAGLSLLLVAAAFALPRRRSTVAAPGPVPNPWLLAGLTAAGGAVFMAGLALPLWPGVAAMLVAPAVVGGLVLRWSPRATWSPWHRLAVAGGALVTYSWHAFTMHTASLPLDLTSHTLYALGALTILATTGTRARRADVWTNS